MMESDFLMYLCYPGILWRPFSPPSPASSSPSSSFSPPWPPSPAASSWTSWTSWRKCSAVAGSGRSQQPGCSIVDPDHNSYFFFAFCCIYFWISWIRICKKSIFFLEHKEIFYRIHDLGFVFKEDPQNHLDVLVAVLSRLLVRHGRRLLDNTTEKEH